MTNVTEKFDVKTAKTKFGKITVKSFDSLDDAKKHLDSMKKKGHNGIISKGGKPVKEESELDEASYNYKRAKDSKKKRLRKKGIGGMIDRAIGRVKKMQDEDHDLALQMNKYVNALSMDRTKNIWAEAAKEGMDPEPVSGKKTFTKKAQEKVVINPVEKEK